MAHGGLVVRHGVEQHVERDDVVEVDGPAAGEGAQEGGHGLADLRGCGGVGVERSIGKG